jgi:two-component system cell cycle response regulator DivK
MHAILLVDDSGLFQEMGAKIESRVPCRLLTASSGSQALAVARKERPDLVCLDAEMSGMTGIDVCRVLKADSQLARTPVLIVSGHARTEEEIRRVGANGWLSKPLEETAFFDSVRRHLHLTPRTGARSAVGWPVTFWRDGVQHDGTLRDLSRGGFFIRTAVRQPVGARLEISFEVPSGKPGRTVVAEAIIVRTAPDPERGLGCRFFRITAGPRAHLEDCLRMLEGGAGGAR